MNEMAMVEYLLKKYALLLYKADNATRADLIYYLYGKAGAISEIITDRFGMKIRETETEYIAENSVCSVRVRKEQKNGKS